MPKLPISGEKQQATLTKRIFAEQNKADGYFTNFHIPGSTPQLLRSSVPFTCIENCYLHFQIQEKDGNAGKKC